jgi:hypothetical protein
MIGNGQATQKGKKKKEKVHLKICRDLGNLKNSASDLPQLV